MILIALADGTVFLFDDDINGAVYTLYFEQLTQLKIIFPKGKVSCFGDAVGRQDEYAHIFTCKIGEFPLRYLGIPAVGV